ncbi:PHD finger protein 20, partial [Chelydra serpentina]
MDTADGKSLIKGSRGSCAPEAEHPWQGHLKELQLQHKVRECVSKKIPSEEAIEMKLLEKDKEGVVNSQLQWQLNLLAHVESLQDEVTHRMDFIEKELDVLESWLDYTGELEPPEPLARLPQLKHCI